MGPTIICAIEETTAETVAPAGAGLAKALGARLVLAHISRDSGLFNSGADRERARRASKSRGREILRRARALLPGDVEAEERVEIGLVAGGLAAIAEEAEAAFIVTGARRRGAIAAALLGSVSRTLAREAPCPVLIVAAKAPSPPRQGWAGWTRSHSTIIVGVDGSERSAETTALAREIADRLGDQLLLVHAHDGTSPPALTEALDRAGDDAALVVENGSPVDALQDVSTRARARMIVIGAGRSDGLGALLTDSVAEQLPSLAPCPVLVVPELAKATLELVPSSNGDKLPRMAAILGRR